MVRHVYKVFYSNSLHVFFAKTNFINRGEMAGYSEERRTSFFNNPNVISA